MNGKVIIGCELNTKELEKDLKNSEKELQRYEKEAEKLTEAKAKIEIDLQEYEKQKQLIKSSTDETLKLASTEEQVNNVLAIENAELEKLNQKYSTQFQKLEEINGKIENNAINQSVLNDKIQETSQKIKQVKGFEKIKTSIDDVNKGLSKTIKKVAKWGLALFGIRTAYNAVRSAMSTLSQYDDQMASNIQYITYALANTLKPVIETILNLIVKLLQYVNYIAKAWTGKNLFKTADAFKDAQKNAKGLNKELQKTTASFDEINKVDSGADTGKISTPNVDLTGMQGEIPAWLQWIVDNKNLLISALFGIAGGIIAIKLGADALMGLGIGLIIAGIAQTIQAIIEFIKDPSWDNFAKILEGLAILLTGVAIAMLAVNAANPVAWIVLAIAAVVALVAIIIEKWDEIKAVLGVVGQWIYDHIIKPVADFFVGLWEGIKNGVGTAVQWIKDKFKSIVDFFSNLISKIVGLFRKIGTKVGDAVSGAFKIVINGVLKAIENILNFPIKSINKLINVINKVPGINISKLPTFELPRLAKGGIINQPGKGVPIGYGQAIGGENKAEGVIPLTDSQQMALLGEAIGKYVRIDNVIDVNMDSRRINRILQSSSNRTAFASNR